MDIRVDTREGHGEYRRWRASGRCVHLDRQNGTNDSRNGEAAQQRGGGDTGCSLPSCRQECPYKGGLYAAVLPPPTLRTSLFARHSRRFTTQNSVFHSTGDPSHWRSRGRLIAESVYWSKEYRCALDQSYEGLQRLIFKSGDWA
jgi:hypothetical protein